MLVSVALVLVMVKFVPALLVYLRMPCVPPAAETLKKILLFAVTEVLATVTVPPTKVAVPIFELVPVLTFKPCPIVLTNKEPVDEFTSPVNTGVAVGALLLNMVKFAAERQPATEAVAFVHDQVEVDAV